MALNRYNILLILFFLIRLLFIKIQYCARVCGRALPCSTLAQPYPFCATFYFTLTVPLEAGTQKKQCKESERGVLHFGRKLVKRFGAALQYFVKIQSTYSCLQYLYMCLQQMPACLSLFMYTGKSKLVQLRPAPTCLR